MSRTAGFPRVLVVALALALTGCGGRKTKPPTEVVEKPAPEATTAQAQPDTGDSAGFEGGAARDPTVWSGDLPLGDAPPEVDRYDEPPGWGITGPDPSALGAGGGLDDPSSPEFQALFADVLFGFDSYRLSPEARQRLADMGSYLRVTPEVGLLIEGHCDERGDAAYNLALGEKRALTVREFLASTGVAPRRLLTVSYGEERPLDPGHDEGAWVRNRRAHFRIRRP